MVTYHVNKFLAKVKRSKMRAVKIWINGKGNRHEFRSMKYEIEARLYFKLHSSYFVSIKKAARMSGFYIYQVSS